jgi:hypothetical protein
MKNIDHFFKMLYRNFNDRKIDAVIVHMVEDIEWANGMEGGYVYGQQAVKEYWTRQFALVSSNVTPLKIQASNDVVKIKVHQVVHDLDGKLLADETVWHIFHMLHDKIALFVIGEKMLND